ncbi:MAG: ABC transporter ATP-binding protein [Candidatus Obscuribacterales bacterium]|nr:ABC transporter ATP-binding protein [Candidatus Obscuribacterales bacterium]
MLSAQNLSKRYDGNRKVEAVSAIDLEINDGEFIAIVGRSGSGKSTLLAMLGGLSRPSQGNVHFSRIANDANSALIDQWKLGKDAQSDFRNRNIGFVFQFASLLPSLRALDNVALPAMISGVLSEKQAYARARALLEQVGLGLRYDFYPNEMSGGEQRRVAIARALINEPDVLMADEPTADLDEQTEAEILKILIEIQRSRKLSLLIVTHNMEVAARADRILQMREGKIVSSTVPKALTPVAKSSDPSAVNLAENCVGESQIVEGKFDQPAAKIEAQAVTLGEGVERFIGRLVLLTLPVIAIICFVNFAVAEFERHLLNEQTDARQALEDMAMTGLRAEVKDVTLGAGRSYDVSIYLRNTLGTKPIYVLTPTLRGFVQVGSTWQEVPLKPANTSSQRVLKITGEQVYHYNFEPDVSDFTQLLPYYMHIRLTNEMLVSGSSQPKSDLIERSDSYYIYLKPHDVSDDAILKKMKFQGKPPVWIPMPPH